ncbi:PEPxxWA-CTERM sorting domain-containing protein [Qipengyuania sphaerica]|uniref:PEPxxWA-CTERM sorting domain-containing protein n=1 Tax=Qipengyuania sphaerica TaxID=2867243 RepID=UPI001C86FDE8|nr:PEPxxWA-CTERM sorting domain-containing protein [Qipengyuania sphaerica]MBX7539383.1 PEPxxWA-CTERM sorting domain-containing protein [Qipengyuania sphaerica]
MRNFLAATAIGLALCAAPAFATETIAPISTSDKTTFALEVDEPCDVTLPVPNATACAGYYSGNLLNGSETDLANQVEALNELGYNFDGDWNGVSSSVVFSLQNGNQINFGTVLYGLTFIGAHFGNVAGDAGNVSVFWSFDFGEEGAEYITLADTQGFSNAVLYSTGVPAVPEPSTWMMLLLGFAAVGFGLRRRSAKRGLTGSASFA